MDPWASRSKDNRPKLESPAQLPSSDSASVAAKRGAEMGPNPTDRGKSGTKRYLVVDRKGTPLGVHLSPANRQ
jgi:hypothetical protein